MATSLKGAATATIALQEGPSVAVSAEDGWMTPPDAGFGLYVHDVRFLSAFEVRVAGVAPLLLSASDRATYVATMQLVNPPPGPPRPADRAGRALRRHVRRARLPAPATRRGDRRAGGRRPPALRHRSGRGAAPDAGDDRPGT